MATNYAYIQIQDVTGRWFTINTVQNNDVQVAKSLDSATAFTKKRARAVTPSGQVIDIR